MSSKINIAFVVMNLYPGGRRIFTESLFYSIDRQQFNPFIYVFDHTDNISKYEMDEYSFIIREGKNVYQICKDFFKLLLNDKIDIIHTQEETSKSLGAIAVALGKVRGHINTFHRGHDIDTDTFKKCFRNRATSIFTNKIVAVSKKRAEYYRAKCWVPKNKMEVIYNGVDLDSFLYKPKEYPNNWLTIGTVARLVHDKGIHLLLRAFAEIKSDKKLKLLIVGDGPEKRNLIELSMSLGINEKIKFVGYQNEITRFLYQMDIFVLPSLVENLPLSCLEAMAAGVPVLTTRVGGIPEYIDHRVNGSIVEPGNSWQIKEELEFLINNTELYHQYHKISRQIVEARFSRTKMVGAYEKLYYRSLGL